MDVSMHLKNSPVKMKWSELFMQDYKALKGTIKDYYREQNDHSPIN